jgi:hypothetical protein
LGRKGCAVTDVREELVVDDPFGQLVPLVDVARIDRDPPLDVLRGVGECQRQSLAVDHDVPRPYLILRLLEIAHELCEAKTAGRQHVSRKRFSHRIWDSSVPLVSSAR